MGQSPLVKIEVKQSPTEQDIANVRDGTLWQFNVANTGDDRLEQLVIYAFAETGEQVGGLIGTYVWGWLHIETLIVIESARGQGIGTKLVQAAEKDAWARGYHNIHLETMSWQARPFYEGMGYEVFATLDDYPVGHQQYFLRKRLTNPENKE